jgi:transposase
MVIPTVRSAERSRAPIVISAAGNCAFSSSAWLGWILVIVAPSTSLGQGAWNQSIDHQSGLAAIGASTPSLPQLPDQRRSEFEEKAADIIGLYLKPPVHAAVFCVDEKSAIQALDRLDPVLPLSPGRAERHGFEYYRHGTLSLYSALNTQSGEVLAKTAARHTSEEFVDFLAQIVESQPAKRQIHVIADNLSAHKSKKVFEFLAANPSVRIHYTPTYSSWLNQVEIWFSKIQRDVIARGVFTSVKDLARKLMRYIRNYNKTATPIRWIYKNVRRRIVPNAI